jgi:glycerol-3-phosphate acyltransferase PlsX
MRIGLDVMGGDHGPQVLIDGAFLALEGNPGITEICFVGDQAQIQAALDQAQCRDARTRIVHASEVMTMEDNPLAAVRKKKDCSMARAIDLLKEGQVDAVISAGNTGGLVTMASVKLHRLEAVERPAIATVIPTAERQFVLLDGGANPECKPLHLLQFAVMGNIYAREMLGQKRPRVGILSNGTEETKGTDLTREAFKLCKAVDMNFVGYVEGHDLFSDHVDVVVTDGFVGNIVLKTIESMGKGFTGLLKKALTANSLRALGATLAKGAFREIKRKFDPEEHGGAPILGLNGNIIKVHGSARKGMVKNAITQTSAAVQQKITEQIRDAVAQANERVAPLIEPVAAPAPG